MKKISTLFKIALGFAGGLLSGAFVRLGFEILNGRPTSVGGEALILPLIVLLLCLGFSLGREFTAQRSAVRAHDQGYREGYRKGRLDGRAQGRPTGEPPLYQDADWQPSTHSAPGR